MSEYRGIDLVQHHDIKAFSKRGGWTITRPFTGSRAQIENAAALAFAANDTFEIIPGRDGDDWELRVIYGAEETQSPDEPISDTWELDGGTLEKEVWELPLVGSALFEIRKRAIEQFGLDLGVDYVVWLKSMLEYFVVGNRTKRTTVAGDEFTPTFASLSDNIASLGFDKAAVQQWLARLAQLFARGVKAFPVSQFVLRRTRSIANNFNKENLTDIYDDIFKRRTTDSLKSAEDIPDTIRFIMPPGEWVKQTPIIKQATSVKWNVVEEWSHADVWEEEIYGELI